MEAEVVRNLVYYIPLTHTWVTGRKLEAVEFFLLLQLLIINNN